MKKFVVLALMAICLCIPNVDASAPPKASQSLAVAPVFGTIVGVDTELGSITFSTSTGLVTVLVGENTVLYKNGVPGATIFDVEVGDVGKAVYDTTTGVAMAVAAFGGGGGSS